MKLYHSTASPYVRKVLMTAWECGLASRIELLPASGTPAAPDRKIAAHNPLMKMPTLRRGGVGEKCQQRATATPPICIEGYS